MPDHPPISALTALPERQVPGAIVGALDKRGLGADATRRRLSGAFVAKNAARPEGCCGLTFTSHAKRIICPLCGKAARAS